MGLIIEMLVAGAIGFVICIALGLYASYMDKKADDKVWQE